MCTFLYTLQVLGYANMKLLLYLLLYVGVSSISEKFVHVVLNHGEYSAAFRVNTFITVDELKHFACKQLRSLSALSIRFSHMDINQVVFIQGDIQLQGLVAIVILMNNEDFYLNVDVIPKHTGCSTSSREFVGGVKAVRIAVEKYKMCTGYKIFILKNVKTRFTAKCEEDGCGWRIHFGPVNGDISRFVLKDSNVIHRLKSPVVTNKLVKHLIADNIQRDPTLKPKQIMSLFKKTYGSNIKYHHARRGKEAVFEDQYGDDEKSYSDLNCYRYLRPMIYLDATFLIGRFSGTLMSATCVNGNDGFYLYAFVIVLSENKDNCLPIGKADANYNVVIDLFYKAAYSYTAANFEEALRGMHAIGCGHVANYLRTIPKEKWANILEFKKLPAFALLDAIRLKVLQMNSKRRVEGLENFNTRLTPVYEDLLNENINIGRTWTFVESMERLYEVRSPRTHSVDLLERTCTCHRWQVNGFPCAHSCAAIQSTREDIYSFVEPYFTTEWYNMTYQEIILPIPNYDKPQSYDPSDRIIVPIPVPPPGRRREQRFKKPWEKQKRPMMCTECFTLGHHNRATCPMP
ncbi:uncharacterized protein LOC113279950 [Papaver somniferum]|uniref:uncharacterized protein LOC113279950 n=1 Tax=Papaver somniferum TaxID=3469 RepID=UPI000E7022AB|nr:uncharacterized protein LOC113279950 [Papaver somniferum]